LNFQGFVCIVQFFVWFFLCYKVVHFYARGFKELPPLHCVFYYLQVSKVEKTSTFSQWFHLLASKVQRVLTPFFHNVFAFHCVFS
jgi:hypothetical protein